MRFYKLLIAVLFTAQIFAQESKETPNTIDHQFKTLYKKSSSYEIYKVISKDSYSRLHNSVLDSINNFNKELTAKNIIIDSQKNTISTLEKTKQETEINLEEVLAKEDSISLFGIPLKKQSYSLVMLSIVFVLVALLLYFLYKFKSCNVLTLSAQSNLEETENEFNIFKKKSIHREQKLRRKLQDEINKNKI